MTELEVLLRDTFNRVAEPGDPAGVVDAIRARVDAGDTGTPANSSGFGGGGGLGGLLPAVALMPWIGGGLVLAIVGGTLGAIGVFGQPTPVSVQAPFSSIERTTDGFDCPGGSPVTTFSANERALVLARTEDSAYLSVRDPYDYRRTVWVPASVVVVDGDQPAIDSLVVSGCYLPIVTVNTQAPAPEPAPAPPPGAAPQPAPGDTTAPTIPKAGASAVPNPIYNAETTVLHVSAVDNVGVTGVSVSWSGAHSGSATMNQVGGAWQLPYDPPDGSYGTITFSFRAYDSAGNMSAPATVNLSYQYFG